MIRKLQWWHWLLAGLFILTLAQPVWAHAVLVRATPAINATLAQPPDEIRLWFTEPLEPKFSNFNLRDSKGAAVKMPASQVDSADPKQMAVKPGQLANGLYTVVWTAVSAADGHHTEGSFPFTVGPAGQTQTIAQQPTDTIPLSATFVRWLNLLGLALGVGSIGFVCFVWQPAITATYPRAEQVLQRIIWIGWLLLGVGGVLMLLLETSIITDRTWAQLLDWSVLNQVVTGTRFGRLWSARMELWLILGGVLWLARVQPSLRWLALLFGLVILLLNSLFSHAAATQDALAAMLSDWFHLTMTAFWIGGLVQFFGIIRPLRQAVKPVTPVLSPLVLYFSNYARILVAGLVITGFYAAWLQVGSLTGLFTTLYGQALLVKLILLVPLLGIAGINLVWTQRRLQAGQAVWAGYLRNLLSAEIVLACGILVAVGLMTSISPARTELAQRAVAQALAAIPPPQPLMDMQEADGLQIHLMMEPGWVGQNRFTVILATPDNLPVTDATLIRLRFQSQAQDLGESELRITEHQGNVYQATGANLSVPGDWQIRMTIQRPEQYDTVVDFTPQVPVAPPPPPIPMIEESGPLPYRVPVFLLSGLFALGCGGYFLGMQRFRFWQGTGIVASCLILIGGLFLVSAVIT